jgi:hypothetical protein
LRVFLLSHTCKCLFSISTLLRGPVSIAFLSLSAISSLLSLFTLSLLVAHTTVRKVSSDDEWEVSKSEKVYIATSFVKKLLYPLHHTKRKTTKENI